MGSLSAGHRAVATALIQTPFAPDCFLVEFDGNLKLFGRPTEVKPATGLDYRGADPNEVRCATLTMFLFYSISRSGLNGPCAQMLRESPITEMMSAQAIPRRGAWSKVDRLEIAFHTAKLREICEKRDTAASELGYVAARGLAERLADVEALDTVADLCALLGPLISNRSPTEKAIHLSPGLDVVFVSGHPSPLRGAPKATDWKKTSRMKITAIEATDA